MRLHIRLSLIIVSLILISVRTHHVKKRVLCDVPNASETLCKKRQDKSENDVLFHRISEDLNDQLLQREKAEEEVAILLLLKQPMCRVCCCIGLVLQVKFESVVLSGKNATDSKTVQSIENPYEKSFGDFGTAEENLFNFELEKYDVAKYSFNVTNGIPKIDLQSENIFRSNETSWKWSSRNSLKDDENLIRIQRKLFEDEALTKFKSRSLSHYRFVRSCLERFSYMVEFNGGEYFYCLYEVPVVAFDWLDAELYCKAQFHGHLLSIKDVEEDDFIRGDYAYFNSDYTNEVSAELLMSTHGAVEPNMAFTRILGLDGNKQELGNFTDGTDSSFILKQYFASGIEHWRHIRSEIWRHDLGNCYAIHRRCIYELTFYCNDYIIRIKCNEVIPYFTCKVQSEFPEFLLDIERIIQHRNGSVWMYDSSRRPQRKVKKMPIVIVIIILHLTIMSVIVCVAHNIKIAYIIENPERVGFCMKTAQDLEAYGSDTDKLRKPEDKFHLNAQDTNDLKSCLATESVRFQWSISSDIWDATVENYSVQLNNKKDVDVVLRDSLNQSKLGASNVTDYNILININVGSTEAKNLIISKQDQWIWRSGEPFKNATELTKLQKQLLRDEMMASFQIPAKYRNIFNFVQKCREKFSYLIEYNDGEYYYCLYEVVSFANDWAHAEKYCITHYGGHLLSIKDEQEAEFIKSLLLTPFSTVEPHTSFIRLLGLNGTEPTIENFTDGTDASYVLNNMIPKTLNVWMNPLNDNQYVHHLGNCYVIQNYCELYQKTNCIGTQLLFIVTLT
uniref:C-type lectin domain-containing protein n=1 Tax=Syphacia muris TaxID=451379 RepID=A0A0N5AJV6_9BILA